MWIYLLICFLWQQKPLPIPRWSNKEQAWSRVWWGMCNYHAQDTLQVLVTLGYKCGDPGHSPAVHTNILLGYYLTFIATSLYTRYLILWNYHQAVFNEDMGDFNCTSVRLIVCLPSLACWTHTFRGYHPELSWRYMLDTVEVGQSYQSSPGWPRIMDSKSQVHYRGLVHGCPNSLYTSSWREQCLISD